MADRQYSSRYPPPPRSPSQGTWRNVGDWQDWERDDRNLARDPARTRVNDRYYDELLPDDARYSSLREPRSRSDRSSTLDSASLRPIISTRAPRSPDRDDYRVGDTSQLYLQPASRTSNRHSPSLGPSPGQYPGQYPARRRDRGANVILTPSRSRDPYRSSGTPQYYQGTYHPADPDYGDDEWGYTNPSSMALYDLDRPRTLSSRRRSLDRDTTRPAPLYEDREYLDPRDLHSRQAFADNPDLPRHPPSRSFDVNPGLASSTLSPRLNDHRGRNNPYDTDANPPRSLDPRGFYNHYETAPATAPQVPSPPIPVARPTDDTELGSRRRTGRPRPVSLYQDPPTRNEFYSNRQPDREPEFAHDRQDGPYHPDSHGSPRDLGIRLASDQPDSRSRGPWSDRSDPRYGHDTLRDDNQYPSSPWSPRNPLDRDPPESDATPRKPKPDDGRAKVRDPSKTFATAGLGAAAAAAASSVGLAQSRKDDKNDQDVRSRVGSKESRDEPTLKSGKAGEHEGLLKKEEGNRQKPNLPPIILPAGGSTSGSSTRGSTPDSDEPPARTRLRQQGRHLSDYDPYDAVDLVALRQKMANTSITENNEDIGGKGSRGGKDGMGAEADRNLSVMPSRPREAASPDRRPSNYPPATKDARRVGDDHRLSKENPLYLVDKSLAVVQTSLDKADSKPLKGILKQPSSKFPEESNPVREGVAPHKDDKKLKEVPSGARWTKISRRIISPEALTLGKERFEVRDDFVVVLRVLSTDEIQTYVNGTKILRDRRRKHQPDGDATKKEVDDRKKPSRINASGNKDHADGDDDDGDDDADMRDRDRHDRRRSELRKKDKRDDGDNGEKEKDRDRRRGRHDDDYSTRGDSRVEKGQDRRPQDIAGDDKVRYYRPSH